MRRQYLDSPFGQVHVTLVGSGKPIILLPWFPLSAEMYASEFGAFAQAGWQVIAVDPLGQGNSIALERSLTIEAHARAIAGALKNLELEKPVVLGGHMGSQIATALIAQDGLNVSALVLDGGPMVDPKVLEGLFAKMGRVTGDLIPEAGETPPDFLFNQALNTYDIFAPGFQATAETLPLVYRFIRDYLNAYLPVGGAGLTSDTPPGYEFAGALGSLDLPTLILTAQTEPLASSFEPMCQACLAPKATHVFPGDHPLHAPARAGEFAAAIDAGLKELGVGPA